MKIIEVVQGGNPIEFLNEVLGVPVAVIAAQLGCDPSYVSHLKSGLRTMNDVHKRKIGKLFDQCLSELEGDTYKSHEADNLISAIIEYAESIQPGGRT